MSEVKKVTVEELDQLLANLAGLNQEKEDIAEALKEKNKEIFALELSAKNYLIELGRTDYDSPHGKGSLKEDFSVKLPQGPDNKKLLWDYMRAEGVYDAYATIHATAYKSYYKTKRDEAVEKGEDPMTFALPGTDPAAVFEVFKFKAKKQKGVSHGSENEE